VSDSATLPSSPFDGASSFPNNCVSCCNGPYISAAVAASSPSLEPSCSERTQFRPGTSRLAVTRRASYHRSNLTPSLGMVTFSLLLDTTTSSPPSSSECITTMTRGDSQGRLNIIIDPAKSWTFDPGRYPGHPNIQSPPCCCLFLSLLLQVPRYPPSL
jgi:hypothetical protein